MNEGMPLRLSKFQEIGLDGRAFRAINLCRTGNNSSDKH